MIFSSDNGPWLSYGDHAGSAGPLREGKGTTFEGGVRVPTVMWWPGTIPAGTVCREPAMTIDLSCRPSPPESALSLPEHPIDGKDIWPLVVGEPGAAARPSGPLSSTGIVNCKQSGWENGNFHFHTPTKH